MVEEIFLVNQRHLEESRLNRAIRGGRRENEREEERASKPREEPRTKRVHNRRETGRRVSKPSTWAGEV